MQLYAQLRGGDEFAKVLASSDQIVRGELAKALNEAVIFMSRKARGYAPIDNGALRDSLSSGVIYADPTAKEMFSSVGTNLRYGVYQEFGTGIYAGNPPIRPKRAKVLRWKSKGGKLIFAKQVKGSRPTKFMQKSRDDTQPLLRDRLDSALSSIMKRLGDE
jgi:hypothetical protein